MAEKFKYLAIRNWQNYQSGKKGWDWIKDYVNQNDDEDLSGLSFFERGLLQELRRLRGRSGKNIHNDVTHIARATHAKATDRAHIRHAIDTLVSRNILVLTNQQVDFVDEKRREEKRGDKTESDTEITVSAKPVIFELKNPDEYEPEKDNKKIVISHWDGKTPPPEDSTVDDLAPVLLNQLGIGLTAATRNAATEAIRLKSQQPHFPIPKAFVHVFQMAMLYKQSPKFKSGFKKSWANWLIDGDYDAQESWSGDSHVTTSGQKIDRGYIPPPKKQGAR